MKVETKPIHKGTRIDRTSKGKLTCDECPELATHVEVTLLGNVTYCEHHAIERAKNGNPVITALPEYRLSKHRLKIWTAQEALRNQESML